MDHSDLESLLKSIVGGELDKAMSNHEELEDQQIARLERIIQRIEYALTGGNGYGINKGIVGAVEANRLAINDLSKGLMEQEKKWDRVKWTVSGVGLGAGLGGGSLVAVFIKVFGG